MRSYRTDVEAFETWCIANNQCAFPASVATVCDFLEAQSKEMAPSSVRRRLYAIRKIHVLLDLPDPTYHEDINLTYRRINRRNAVRPKQAKALTREYLDRFLAAEPDTAWGLRNRAMLSLGYELLTRRSELVALRTSDIETTKDGTLRVLIRRSKADPFGEGRLGFTSRKTAMLVQDWLDWRGPTIEWLFCPIYQNKAINRSMETTTIKRLVKTAARRAGLDKADIDAFSGHSLRVGAAQDLLVKGFDTVAIMRAGGWKTVGVLARYLEKAEHNVWG
jgi:integrase/recombinase XerD